MRHNVKKYIKTCHDINPYTVVRKYTVVSKVRYDVKTYVINVNKYGSSWCYNITRDVQNIYWHEKIRHDDGQKLFVAFKFQIQFSFALSFQEPPKGAKVYPASRRRSIIWVGLKGQLSPHCVPWLKNSIMAYKRLSTSLGSKTLNNTSSLGLGGTKI